jgi:two-component system chemotaxis sensor kinase CheA
MDDLLREFLTETSESLDTVDNQLVRFEQDPSDAKILDNIFRLVHTIKGTCGFLGLPRLEALAHAGETLMGKFRDGMPVTAEAVTLILSSIDRIKEILAGLEATETEPEGTDEDLIEKLQRWPKAARMPSREPAPVVAAPPVQPRSPRAKMPRARWWTGAGTPAASRRSLARRLERAFRETETEVPAPSPRRARRAEAGRRAEAARKPRQSRRKAARRSADVQEADKSPTSRSASTSTRWNI